MARSCSTICLPIDQDSYPQVVADPARFRAWLDGCFGDHPEPFAQGYRLEDDRTPAKLGVRIRLKATGEPFSVRPSFASP